MSNSTPASRGGIGAFLPPFLGLYILWIIFVGSFDVQELIAGAVVAAFAAVLSSRVLEQADLKLPSPARLGRAVLFLGVLAVEIVRANLDMARIVSAPRIAIKPGIVKVRTTLKSPLARLILANSITLTPGTLSVDVKGEDLFVHWVNVEADDHEAATRKIVAGFEKHLEVIFG